MMTIYEFPEQLDQKGPLARGSLSYDDEWSEQGDIWLRCAHIDDLNETLRSRNIKNNLTWPPQHKAVTRRQSKTKTEILDPLDNGSPTN